LSTDRSLTIALGPAVKRDALGGFDREAIARVEGASIALPKNAAHRPDPALIRRRYADKR